MRGPRRAAASAAAALLLAGCGGSPGAKEHRNGAETVGKPADRGLCAADAKAVSTPYGGQFPDDWPFPPGTTVYDVEDRGAQGTIVTAVSTAPFRSILDFLNRDVAGRGYRVQSGETEDHDAEATWAGNGHRGRWAIRESARCPGETVVQVLAERVAG